MSSWSGGFIEWLLENANLEATRKEIEDVVE